VQGRQDEAGDTGRAFWYSCRVGQARGNEQGLRRQLGAGQMAMVGVGGSIGTGLLLGSAAAIQIAGPAVILSFVLAALIAYSVTMAMAELASLHPAAGSFGTYGEIYLSPWAGFVSRYGYWIAIAMAIGGEMVASATYMRQWLPGVPPLVWICVFASALLVVNLMSVGHYAWFEYGFAMVKLLTMMAFVALGGVLLVTGHLPPQYSSQGGFFPRGHAAPLYAMAFALFTFAGVEMVAISSGESRSGREVGRAMRLAFALLACVYLGSIVVLVGIMPWHGAGVMESPFVTVFKHVGLPAAGHLMNFVVLTAALSGANASLYVDSRMLFSLARGGYAPQAMGHLNESGTPMSALLFSSVGIVVALVLQKWAPADAFVYILGAALFGAMLSWLVALAAHVVFRRRITRQQLADLPVRSRGGAWLSAAGFIAIVTCLLTTWGASPVTVVSGVVYLIILSVAYLLARPNVGRRLASDD
jgi:amino acid transporter, AAT family